MSDARWWLLALGCVASLVLQLWAVPAEARVERGADAGRTTLPGHVLPAVVNATPVKSSKRTQPMTLTLVLRHSDEDGFRRYLQTVYDPNAEEFRRYLPQNDLTDRFG